MTVNGVSLKASMNKHVQAIMPLDEEKQSFNGKIVKYLSSLLKNKNETEEFQKNLLKDFLVEVLPNNFMNTSKNIDLAIYNGKDSESTLGVIFECKSLNNKFEMMSKENFNSKAFQEAVSYYLKERIINKNIEVKKIIITNGLSWFVIESKEFEKFFYKNKNLNELYHKFIHNQLASNSTEFLYSEVISPFIEKAIDKGITIAHFNLTDALVSPDKIEIKKSNLTQLYRFFTPENLLNKEIFTDSNKLNKTFYDELLYLMGLEETKQGTSKIISRLKVGKRQRYSFVENVIAKLDTKDIEKDKQEDIAIQLTVVWMNRILFLKLLESQLVLFNNNSDFKFMSYQKLPGFDVIYDLFFAVLAKKVNERNEWVMEKFSYVPYLNSSLFESTELELSVNGLGIDNLSEGDIEFYNKTVIKGANKKRKTGKVNFLEYLFDFLDSYDFSTTLSHHVQSKNDLINASVLGLIFEKINGYKDGSFYTPGHITMFMAKRAVRDAAIEKINDKLSWNCHTIEDIKFKIENTEIARRVSESIDDLKICDPAVGSGHFLVSVLNEIIALKTDLNVLFDIDGKYLGNLIQCYVINDELVIQNKFGDNFLYQVGNQQSEQIQKAIFEMKRHIIEKCLFAVDINSSSVNICRLRLWIELLKSSYYYVEEDSNLQILTTLPNIDINIKVGDSLLHKFEMDYEFDLRRTDFKNYLSLVNDYRETNNKQIKKVIWDKIEHFKHSFDDTASSPEMKKLNSIIGQLGKVGEMSLFEEENKDVSNELAILNSQYDEAIKDLNKRLKNPLYSKGLEWRMEFPEILGDNGEFIGFDLVIGNPPYIFTRGRSFTDEMKNYYQKTYTNSSEFKANTYTFFIELAYQLLKPNGIFSFIVPNNILTIGTNSKIRNFLMDNTGELSIINSLDNIFTDASVDNCIISFKKESPSYIEIGELNNGEINTISKVPSDFYKKDNIISISKAKYKHLGKVFNKVDNFPPLNREEIATVKTGVQVYGKGQGEPKQTKEKVDNRVFHSFEQVDSSYRKYLDGENVSRYNLTWNNEWVKYGNHMARMRNPEIFEEPRILVRQIPTNKTYSIEATLVEDDYISDVNSHIITFIKVNPRFLLGLINSKLLSIWFVLKFDKFQRRIFPQFKIGEMGEFPIPESSQKQQEEIANVVSELIEEMSKIEIDNNKIEYLNLLIDDLVMDLYELDEQEKNIVLNFEL